MKVRRSWLALAYLCASPLLAQPIAVSVRPTVAATVSVEGSDKHGSGLVVRVGGQCIVITALHVVDGQDGIRITTSARESWTGDVKGRAETADIATIVSDAPGKSCSEMPAADVLTQAVQASEGKLLIAGRGSDVLPIPVTVLRVGVDYIRIRSNLPGFTIQQGMSGSPLLMNNVPVAILTGIASNEFETPGLAIRLDHTARLMGQAVLPLVEITVQAASVPLLQSLGDSIARADAAALARFRGQGVGAPDIAAALRQPSDTAFVADRLFEAIHTDPHRVSALAELLGLGLAPDLIVPARDTGDPAAAAYDKSLFWHAIDAGAVDAAVLLLKHGASPHGYRAPDRASPSNRMILPTSYIYEKVTEPEDRKKLFAAMIDAGLVLPIAPQRFVSRKDGPDCKAANVPCPGDLRGEWREGYDIWADKNDLPAFQEVSAIGNGAARRNFKGQLSCLASQSRKPPVPTGWEATLAKMPSFFRSVVDPESSWQPDFGVEGFIGVFNDRAWFLVRRRDDPAWIDVGDLFSLMSASRDLSRIDVYEDKDLCGGRSCLRVGKVDVLTEKGAMVIVDGRDHRWIGERSCGRAPRYRAQ